MTAPYDDNAFLFAGYFVRRIVRIVAEHANPIWKDLNALNKEVTVYLNRIDAVTPNGSVTYVYDD